AASFARLEMLQGEQMGVGQIIDMNVVAEAGPIGRRVVRAEDLDGWPLSHRGLDDEWNEMRFGIVVLANTPIGTGARRVEVAECRIAPLVCRGIVGERALDSELTGAVGIDRMLGLVLGDRYLPRRAVRSAGTGKYHAADAIASH